MPRITRQSIHQNILNRSSDGDIDSKRDSRRRKQNLDNSQQDRILINSQLHPDSYTILNPNSTEIDDQNSQWWKNLSENNNTTKLNKVDSVVKDNTNNEELDKNLSQDSDKNEKVIKKNIFGSQEERYQKKRYSKAFINISDKMEEAKEIKPIHNLKNDHFVKVDPRKDLKRKRKTKPLFSKKTTKRKFSDAFIKENTKFSKNDIDGDENISMTNTENNTKERLSKSDQIKKKHSQAFLNISNNEHIDEDVNLQEIGGKDVSDLNKCNKSNEILQIKETDKKNFKNSVKYACNLSSDEDVNVEEIHSQNEPIGASDRNINITTKTRSNIFKTNLKKKKYSEAFVKSTSSTSFENLFSNDDLNEEDVNVEEIHSQNEPIGTSDRNINITRKTRSNIFKTNIKEKKYSEAFVKSTSSTSFENLFTNDDMNEDVNVEEIHSQNEPIGASDRNINITRKTRSNIFKTNLKRKKNSEAFVKSTSSTSFENLFTNDDMNEEDVNVEEIHSQNEPIGASDRNINITRKTRSNIFKTNLKKKKYSEAFVKSTSSTSFENLFTNDDMNEEDVNVEEIHSQNEPIGASDRNINITRKTRSNIFKTNLKKKKYSEAFVKSTSSTSFENLFTNDDMNEEDVNVEEIHSQNEPIGASDRNINITRKTRSNIFKTNLKEKKYSAAFVVKSTSDTSSENVLINQDMNNEELISQDLKPTNEQSINMFKKKRSDIFNAPQNQNEWDSHEKTTRTSQIQEKIKLFINFSSESELSDKKDIKSQKNPSNTSERNDKSNKFMINAKGTDVKVNAISECDSKFDSISSINITEDIKKPLFITKALKNLQPDKSLYQNNVLGQKGKQIASKRYSLRSTSPSESAISKFFEQSLISSTKLIINDVKNTDSENSSNKNKKTKSKTSFDNRSAEDNNNTEIDTSNKSINTKAENLQTNKKDIWSNSTTTDKKPGESENKIIRSLEDGNSKEIEKSINNEDTDSKDLVNKKKKRKSRTRKSTLNTVDEHSNEVENEIQDLEIHKNEKIEKSLEPVKISDSENSTNRNKSKKFKSITPDKHEDLSEKEMIKSKSIKKSNKILKEEKKTNSMIAENFEPILNREEITEYKDSESNVQKDEYSSDLKRSSIVPLDRLSNSCISEHLSMDNEKSLEALKSMCQIKQLIGNLTTEEHNKKDTETKNFIEKKTSKEQKITKTTGLNTSSDNDTENINKSVRASNHFENVRNWLMNNKFDNNNSEKSNEKLSDINSDLCNRKQIQSIESNKNNKSKKTIYSDIDANPIITLSSSSSNKDLDIHKTNTKPITEKKKLIQNKNSNTFISNLGSESDIRKGTSSLDFIKKSQERKPCNTSDNELEKRRNLFLEYIKNNSPDKDTENKSSSTEAVKKIINLFSKMNKNVASKPAVKKNNIVKKKPLCTAKLVNGKIYRPRLYRAKWWCTDRLYKLLQNKMREKYDFETVKKSEELMKFMVDSVSVVIKLKKYVKSEVDNLKKRLAKEDIIKTTYDFYLFVDDYLPFEYRDLVVPCTKAHTAIPTAPYNHSEVFKNISFD